MSDTRSDLADRLGHLTEDVDLGEEIDEATKALEDQAARWRQWIDQLRVDLDLGAADLRDDLRAVLDRLEDAYVGFASLTKRAATEAKGGAGDLRERAVEARHQLARAATTALDRLKG